MECECPVCGLARCNKIIHPNNQDIVNYDCRNCQRYFLNTNSDVKLKSMGLNEVQRAILSHAIWKMQNPNNVPTIGSDDLEKLLNNEKLPSPDEQAARGSKLQLNRLGFSSVILCLNNQKLGSSMTIYVSKFGCPVL